MNQPTNQPINQPILGSLGTLGNLKTLGIQGTLGTLGTVDCFRPLGFASVPIISGSLDRIQITQNPYQNCSYTFESKEYDKFGEFVAPRICTAHLHERVAEFSPPI